MTQNLADQVIRPSYEQARDSLPHPGVRDVWRNTDRRVEYTKQAMQDIHDDESLSEEGKREKAQRLIDTNAERIRKAYEEARTKTQNAAESSWRFSIPMPGDGKTLPTTQIKDSTEMLAVQMEASAIATRISGKSLQELTSEKAQQGGNKGIRQSSSHTLEALQAEFDAAMAASDVEGKIRGLAVKRVCDDMGIRIDDVVDHHRRQIHRNAYADAERFESALGTIPSGKRMAENPYDSKRQGGKGRIGTYDSGNKAMVSSGRPKLFKKANRRRPWK